MGKSVYFKREVKEDTMRRPNMKRRIVSGYREEERTGSGRAHNERPVKAFIVDQ